MSQLLNVHGWSFEFTEAMLEHLRDSRATDPAIVLYVESNKVRGYGPFAGDWDVRSTLPSGGPEYAIVLPRENIPLRGDLHELAEKLNDDTPYWDWQTRRLKTWKTSWPRVPATEGDVIPAGRIGSL